MKNAEFIKRNYPAEFRAESENGLIVGVPIVFDTPTDIGGMFQETIVKGAITKEVLREVDFYFNHDLNAKRIASTIIPIEKLGGMQLNITENGVEMRVNPNRKRTDVNDLYLSIEDGTTSGMSFMFGVAEERWEDENTDYPKRYITKIEPVVEVSAVNYPAYKSTSINVSRGDSSTESDKVALEKMRAEKRASAEKLAKEKREFELLTINAKYLF